MSYREALLEATDAGPALCVGLDPHPALLQDWGLADDARGLEEFVRISLEAIQDTGVRIAKPQVALFERHGVAGMRALAIVCAGLREAGVLVIGDAKRGDIGSTMAGYAHAWLAPGVDFEVDALTINPYLGVGALYPALEAARDFRKGVFVLAATSNPEAWGIQTAVTDHGLTVAARVLAEVTAWESEHAPDGPGTVGVVIGATVDQEALGLDLSRHPQLPVLAPGYGAQGAALADAARHFPDSQHLIAVAGRSVLHGPAREFGARILAANRELLP